MRTVLGKDVQTREAIMVNDKARRSGTYIVGAQGLGKSLLLANLIYQDAKKGYAVIVIDPHGDLIEHVIAILPEERLPQTYLLDLTDTNYPFGLNLFSCTDSTDEIERTVALELVMHVFEKVWQETQGLLLSKMLRFIMLTFLEHPGCTLSDIRRLLWDDTYRAHMVGSLTNDEVKAYWELEYNAMTIGERRKEVQALDNRLAALRTTPLVRHIVDQPKNTIEFRQAIQAREILLIHLPKRLKTAADLVGTILLAQIHAATFAFGALPWNERPGFSLYVDEFQHYATSDFAELFREGRKFGVRITVAHQDRQNLLPDNRSATLTASTIICFRLTPTDASELAPLLFDALAAMPLEHVYPDVLHRLRRHKRREVQDYYQRYVAPLLMKGGKRAKDQGILELLEDLLYHALRTSIIDEELFAAYTMSMCEHLKLTFAAPQRQRRRLHEELRLQEYRIARLQQFLSTKEAIGTYLVDYYTYYDLYRIEHPVEWYYEPWIPQEHLLADTQYWQYVWGNRSFAAREPEPLESIMNALRDEAQANQGLWHRSTPAWLIADEKAKLVTEWKRLFQLAWEGLATIYAIKSRYADHQAVRAFYAQEHHRCITTPVAQQPEPFYLDIFEQEEVGRRAARNRGFAIRQLPLEHDVWQRITAWIPAASYYVGYEASLREAFRAADRLREIWSAITWRAGEMQRIRRLLSDDTAVLKSYYAKIGNTSWKGRFVWERLNNDHVESHVWEALRKEARRNTVLSLQMNTVEKIVEARKDELRQKIALLMQERVTYLAALRAKETRIQEEVDNIQEGRTAFENTLRRVIDILLDDPDVLGIPKKAKESDAKERLLSLPKRQALVRVSGGSGGKPHICTMETTDVPQAVKRDVVVSRRQQIRARTRAKYCQQLDMLEQEHRDEPMGTFHGEDAFGADERPAPWYEG